MTSEKFIFLNLHTYISGIVFSLKESIIKEMINQQNLSAKYRSDKNIMELIKVLFIDIFISVWYNKPLINSKPTIQVFGHYLKDY